MNRLRTKCCTANIAELSSCRLEADVPVLGVRLKLAVGHKATHALFALERTLPRMNPLKHPVRLSSNSKVPSKISHTK